jgi:hypothetical protein
VTRNQWRDEMIERHIARYNWHTGKWGRAAEAPRSDRYGCRQDRARFRQIRYTREAHASLFNRRTHCHRSS